MNATLRCKKCTGPLGYKSIKESIDGHCAGCQGVELGLSVATSWAELTETPKSAKRSASFTPCPEPPNKRQKGLQA